MPPRLRIDPFAGFSPFATQARFMRWVPPNPKRPDLRLLSSGFGSGGKLLALDTPLPTPGGWTTMGDVEVGAELFDESGQRCRVVGVFDEVPERAWRLRFSDRTEIVAGGEHLWITYTPGARGYARRKGRAWWEPGWAARRGPVTTDVIVESIRSPRGETRHAIPTCLPLDLPEVDLLVPPYVLGAWLGDGTSATANLTCADQGILDEIVRNGCSVRHLREITYRIGEAPRQRDAKGRMAANGSLESRLRALGLLGDKHIPADYMRASAGQRLALLQGLMDTDGYASCEQDKGRAEFTSTRRVLAEGVVELARSLGQKPVISESRATLYGRDCGPKWRVTWSPTTPDVFRLERKRQRIRVAGNSRAQSRTIQSATLAPVQPMRCIAVDSPNRLYLAGAGMIPTHNTTVGCRESIRYTLAFPRSRNAVSRFHYDDLADTTMVSFFEALERIGLSDGSKPGMRHYVFRKSPRPEITWWNGSETLFRNLDDPSGSKYGSMEVNTWFVDEGFEVPSDVLKVIYPSRLRWHLPGCPWKQKLAQLLAAGGDPSQLPCACPKRMWACTNPGPNEFWERLLAGGLPNAEHFPVPFRENQALGADYFDALEEAQRAYGPAHLARWAYGSWDAFEGQRFAMLDRARHFLPVDLNPGQDEFEIIEAHDFGWRNPHATVWIAVHKAREWPPIVVDDYEVAEREIPKHAEALLARRRQYGWRDSEILAVGDPAGMQTRGAGVSDIMLFAAHGIEIVPMSRAKMPDARADLLALMLSRGVVTREGAMAGLMFNPRAHRTFERLLRYRYADKSRTAQVDAPERFQKKDDHLVDAAGYGVSAIGDPLEAQESEAAATWKAMAAAARMPTPDELNAQAFAPAEGA